MRHLKIKKNKEHKIIWSKIRKYIDFVILWCCLIIAFNIHPNKISENSISQNESKMIFIFHDYEWNEYIMNENIHGASNYWDYLFEDEIPNDLKWDEVEISESVSLKDLIDDNNSDEISESWNNSQNSDFVKKNQVSIENIMSDLWFDWNNINWETNNEENNTNNKENETSNDENKIYDNELEINISNTDTENQEDSYYTISEEDSSMIIEKIKDDQYVEWQNNENLEKENDWKLANIESDNQSENNLSIAKAFTFTEEWRVLPILIARNDLQFGNVDESIDYKNIKSYNYTDSKDKKWWITIIEDYADCNTPRWYKIKHWESVLAYKQMDNNPEICNIERRFCWKWKLSWTYTQQWCSVNKSYTNEPYFSNNSNNYSYETNSETNEANSETSNKSNWNSKQKQDENIKTTNEEIWESYVFDRPNYTKSDFTSSDNLRTENQELDQTKRPHFDCTAPRWEKVKHGQFIQAFKHANWFYDAPCEMQIRLCSEWELLWTYKESTCKTWDTSFIDWVNGSPTRQTYSKEKLEWVKKQISNEQNYYEKTRKDATRSTNSTDLDRILFILDQD